MAISLVGWDSGSGTGTVTLELPSGVRLNDLLIVAIEGEGFGGTADQMNTPGDWPLLGITVASGTAQFENTRLTLWGCWYDPADPPDMVVADAGDHTLAAVSIWRGVDTTVPFDGVAPATGFSTNPGYTLTSFEGEEVEAVTTGAVVVVWLTTDDNITIPITNQNIPSATATIAGVEVDTTSGDDGTLAFFYGTMSGPGSTGTPTWSIDQPDRTAWATVVLRAAPPAPSGPAPVFELGCAENYQVIITARDLETYAAEVRWSSITWSRVLDEISEATIVAPDIFGGLRCNIELGTSIVPWKFGIRIERNGQLVWAGPITMIERPERDGSGADFVTISAQDKMAWMTRRTVTNTLEFTGEDAGTVFKAVLEEGTSQDNLFGLYCPTFQAGYTMTRTVLPLDFEYIFDILTDLAGSAVDWFVIGNELAVQNQTWLGTPGGWYVVRDGSDEVLEVTSDPFGRYFLGLFTDESYVRRPGYVIDGFAQGNNIFVPGADSGEAGFRRYWTASDVDAETGILTYVDVNTLYRPQEGTPITADAVFQERADSLLALRRNAPVIISGGVLSQAAPVTVDTLFPGSLWSIDLADHGISQLLAVQRLKRVDVTVSVAEDGLFEEITPTLIPLGTDESEGG